MSWQKEDVNFKITPLLRFHVFLLVVNAARYFFYFIFYFIFFNQAKGKVSRNSEGPLCLFHLQFIQQQNTDTNWWVLYVCNTFK